MTTFQHVLPTSEARIELAHVLERFRRDGVSAEPLVFGPHRRAEGVVIPFALYEAMLPLVEDVLIASSVKERLQSDVPARSGGPELLEALGLPEADVDPYRTTDAMGN